jgi:cysteine desulfurase
MSSGLRIYADYNATAPLRPEAKAAMISAMSVVGNPSSVHAEGRKARALVEGGRDAVAAAIGACRDDIVFTSGGTEAVALPLRGVMRTVAEARLVSSDIEHDAVASLASGAQAWPVKADGLVDIDWLQDQVSAFARQGLRPLVSLMLVNNETGVIQPIAAAAEIAHAAGGLIHCDAVQGLGKIEVSIIDLEVDYLSLSAHKIGGPQGMGATYIRPGAPFGAIQTGGGQEFGRRAGTENVVGIAGFAAAISLATRTIDAYRALGEHRDRMEEKLRAAAPTLKVHGDAASRVAGVSCFGVEDLPAETQIMGLDLAGFAVSAGAACSSGKVKPSRVLTAMGLEYNAARSAIRASFGWQSAWQDFDALAEAWIRHAARARPHLVNMDAYV